MALLRRPFALVFALEPFHALNAIRDRAMASTTEHEAMRLALALAATEDVPHGPNPRVGAVIVDTDGRVVGRGFHQGAGRAHAEVAALADAGEQARGGVAVVTLEPCNHHGRTGPCSAALLDAGIQRVVFGQSDTSPIASGGAAYLSARGVDVEGGLLANEAESLNERWTFAHQNSRPWITYKFAATLDGRVAAPDGSSQWITSEEARRDVHRLRAQVDAVMVGTGTVVQDNPQLTARGVSPLAGQPTRVVIGQRDLPKDSRVFAGSAATLHLRTHDVLDVSSALYQKDVQWVLLEGGPTLAGAFLAAGLVNEVVAYVAPALLGGGQSAVDIPGVQTIDDIARLTTASVEQVGPDVKIIAKVARS